jgi:aspartyl-tRNA(Asn)/glutamyl-tRNA(Gln) amidotransferase subunit C
MSSCSKPRSFPRFDGPRTGPVRFKGANRGVTRLTLVAITREDVLHVARLARLEIPESELERVREQLGAILEAVGKVSELELSGVEPTSHPLDVVNVWADDESRPSLPLDDALANAPDPADGAFRVPAVG